MQKYKKIRKHFKKRGGDTFIPKIFITFAAAFWIIMKKIIFTTIILLTTCILSTSCHKDCVCKYYRNDKLYDIKTWDDKHVTDEDCEGMNDSRVVSIPLDELTDLPVGEAELVNLRVECARD